MKEITGQINDIASNICDHFCKYNGTGNDDVICAYVEKHGHCPLDLLTGENDRPKLWKCTECGDTFAPDEIEEDFYEVNAEAHLCICPDCMDNLNHLDADDMFDYLMKKGD